MLCPRCSPWIKRFIGVPADFESIKSQQGRCQRFTRSGPDVAAGLRPSWDTLSSQEPLYLAIGILGATVMPHNLYLHSSVVQTRVSGDDAASKRSAIRFSRLDTIGSLSLALLVNAAILILAAAAFHGSGHAEVVEIQDAYHLLDPLVGGALASFLFGFALLAGQSSTFTGTIAGQVVMEGFLRAKIPCWQRRRSPAAWPWCRP